MEKLVVLGAGESGVGTAILGKKEGFEVFVSDLGIIKEKYKQVLLHHEILWEEGSHSEDKILSADIVMKSPGIPDVAPIILKLKEKAIKVISEIEFAAKFTEANIIGITGSNGKTTVATMVYQLFNEGDLNVALGGNIGESFAKLVAAKNHENYVLELSSFQLDGIEGFAPHISVLTNLSPDHLDRYENDYSKYIDSKFRITMNQTSDDYFIYDGDDEMIQKWLSKHTIKPQLLPFSITKQLNKGAFIKDKEIIITIDNKQFTMPIADLGLQGQHNVKNAMAASTVAKLLNIRKETIRRSLENFQGVEHRLESVLKINNVK